MTSSCEWQGKRVGPRPTPHIDCTVLVTYTHCTCQEGAPWLEELSRQALTLHAMLSSCQETPHQG